MAQMQLTLQPRLQAIADLVPQGSRIADVGTDHGYLPIYLLQRNRISCAIATDIRPGPLEHGKRTAREWGREHQISFRLCDGLAEVSPQEVDTVVIAGMGGETIAAILDAVPWCHEKELLLQPMSRAEFRRNNWYWIRGISIQFCGRPEGRWIHQALENVIMVFLRWSARYSEIICRIGAVVCNWPPMACAIQESLAPGYML